MFYTYEQNNICGKIITNKGKGISKYVIIEADSTTQADKIALKRGLYFDGFDGVYADCSCCGGDRWVRAEIGYPEPTIKGKPVNIIKGNGLFNVYIHYLDHTRKKGWKPDSAWF